MSSRTDVTKIGHGHQKDKVISIVDKVILTCEFHSKVMRNGGLVYLIADLIPGHTGVGLVPCHTRCYVQHWVFYYISSVLILPEYGRLRKTVSKTSDGLSFQVLLFDVIQMMVLWRI